MPDHESYTPTWPWIVGVVAVTLFSMCLMQGISSGPASPRSTCRNNLKQIGLALHNYMDAYDSLPPAYVADENGKPLYSWRVLILPFLEQQNLYELMNLSKPWDAPENITLTSVELPVFHCPSIEDPQALQNRTNYVAIIGQNTAWRGAQPVPKGELGDNWSELFLVAEIADERIPWAKPMDLHIELMAKGINSSNTNGVSSQHDDGAQVLLGDGHVRYLLRSEISDVREGATIEP